MEKDLTMLTEKQRTAYLLREQGLTYRRIAEETGVTINAARLNIQGAVRRLKEYGQIQKEMERDSRPVDFPVSGRDLDIIISAMVLLEKDMFRKYKKKHMEEDWTGIMAYEYQTVRDLFKRAQTKRYGNAPIKDILSSLEYPQ